MKKRDGFVLHDSTTLQFAELTGEEVALVVRAIIAYHFEGKEPDFPDRFLRMAFSDFRRRYDEDAEKYLNRCEQNRANINERWSKQSNTSEYNRIQSNTTNTDEKRTDEKRIDKNILEEREGSKNVFM